MKHYYGIIAGVSNNDHFLGATFASTRSQKQSPSHATANSLLGAQIVRGGYINAAWCS